MIISAFVVGLIIIGLIFLVNHISSNGSGGTDTGFFFGILIVVLGFIEIGIVSKIIKEPKPTAMDVYQGKTTLKYEVVDGEIIDSCVVWKGEIDNED